MVLRVRFGNLISDYDQIEVEWNGRLLPESILQKSEMTYRPTGNVSTGHAIGPYGYAFDYHLGSEHFPEPGRNRVQVKLLKRDSNLVVNLSVRQVDCRIRYRYHRHFEGQPIQY